MSRRQRQLARNAKMRTHATALSGTPYAAPFAAAVATVAGDVPVSGVLKAPVPAFPTEATVYGPDTPVTVDANPDAVIEAAIDTMIEAARTSETVTRYNDALVVSFRGPDGIDLKALKDMNRTELRLACKHHGIAYSQLRTDGMKVALTNKLQPVG